MEQGLDGTQLKWIALFTMLADHAGLVFMKEAWPPVYWGMRLIGRLSFPLYCFLLVEGFCHTRDSNRYLVRLIGLAFLSELPFDLMNGNWGGFTAVEFLTQVLQGQNVMFTLALGLVALKGCVTLQNSGHGAASVLWCVALGGLAWLIRADYDWAGVALICFLYRFRQEPEKRLLFGGSTLILGISPIEAPALVSFALMRRYNGQRGRARFFWGFYLFYPLHMLVLWWGQSLYAGLL